LLLALGDYALWNWSLGTNHDIVALVAGMALIPLLIASVWLLAVACAHLIAYTARRPRTGAHAQAGARARSSQPASAIHPTPRDPAPAGASEIRTTASPSSKIAA
jgi:hypothetical protein